MSDNRVIHEEQSLNLAIMERKIYNSAIIIAELYIFYSNFKKNCFKSIFETAPF